jgi:LAS superfamily LD-carboxypeptidase LdcB
MVFGILSENNGQLNNSILLGRDPQLLVDEPSLNCSLQAEVMTELLRLHAAAARAGFALRVASSYRSFERQLLIWNNKAAGVRPVLDDRGLPLDISRLGERDLVYAILRWSALPGASRHHWGTDLDVYDASRMPANYQVQLTQAETQGDGPFAEFHRWLTEELTAQHFLFYRPYVEDRGGIAPEPWHLSYAPLASLYSRALTVDILRQQLEQTDILLRSVILDNLDDIYRRFVRVDADFPQAY